jgi:EAL domain-containing protein (putative c-di-GMP-specific phosphodiesterase class I)
VIKPYSFAFQPIADTQRRCIESFEALVRGPAGEGADWVMGQLDAEALRQFDIDARLRAIALAGELQLAVRLNLNLLPDSVEAAGGTALTSTVDMATIAGLKVEQLVLEVSEREVIRDTGSFVARANLCRALGVRFAIDDFGSGYSGLNLLADFQPEQVKLDMLLVRDVHRKGPRQAITRGVLRTCEDLGIEVVAEGVETLEEYRWLSDEGIHLFQGYLFARPAFERLPEVQFPD